MRLAIAISLFVSVASAADAPVAYRDGWTYMTFYQEADACRSIMVSSAAQSFLAKGNAAHQVQDKLRSEVISVLPAMDIPASNGCYCAVSEIAKSRPYSEYLALGDISKRLDVVAAKLKESPCADRLQSSQALLQKKEALDAVRLK
jgi:hypothetical protein